MTNLLFSNNATTTLQGTITSTAATAALASGTGALFPTPAAGQGFYGSFQDALTGLITEIVLVTAMSGDSITAMVRGQDNTTARAWAANDVFSLFVVAGDLNAMGQKTQIQGQNLVAAADSGAANAYAVALTPAPTLALYSRLVVSIGNANTGASTLAVNGGTAYPIWGANGTALQGGELPAGTVAEFYYHPTAGTGSTPVFFLVGGTKGAIQISPGLASNQAAQISQIVGNVGQSRNLKCVLATSGSTATWTADEVITQSALGGLSRLASNVNISINLTTTASPGVSGVLGPALTSGGYVAIYLLQGAGVADMLVAVNAANATPEICALTPPAGYTTSAKISVVPMTGANFAIFTQYDRNIDIFSVQQFSTSTATATAISVPTVGIPKDAKSVSGGLIWFCGSATSGGVSLYAAVAQVGGRALQNSINAGEQDAIPFSDLILITPQTLFYTGTSSVSGALFAATLNGYKF